MTGPLHTMRCPRCNDDLRLYHAANTGRPRHFFGCQNPACSYTAEYDEALHALLRTMEQRLLYAEAQIAWLTGQLEALGVPSPDSAPLAVESPTERRRALPSWADVAHLWRAQLSPEAQEVQR